MSLYDTVAPCAASHSHKNWNQVSNHENKQTTYVAFGDGNNISSLKRTTDCFTVLSLSVLQRASLTCLRLLVQAASMLAEVAGDAVEPSYGELIIRATTHIYFYPNSMAGYQCLHRFGKCTVLNKVADRSSSVEVVICAERCSAFSGTNSALSSWSPQPQKQRITKGDKGSHKVITRIAARAHPLHPWQKTGK